ncbi:MAG: uncharacterized membrane protein (UPF0182 family), partial [Myxococcota bacterium]
MQIPRWMRLAVAIVILLWLGNRPITGIAVDWLWFDALGYLSVFKTSLTAKVGMWVLGLVVTAGFIGANLRVAVRDEPI